MTVHEIPIKRKVPEAERLKQAAAIKECLHYLMRDALESNLPMTAQMISVSTEAVLMDLEQLQRRRKAAAQA